MVSIIIPIYNAEKYLRQCLDSVLAQTYEDWEMVLIDDGSTDESGKLCEEYSNKDNRIKVFHIANGGPSVARNFGIEKSKGEYIYFMDSDDIIESKALEILVNSMNQGYDMVSCNYIREMPNGNVLRNSNFKSGEYVFHNLNEKFQFICSRFLCYEFGWEGWNRLYRRDIIENKYIRFCTKSQIGEDMLFCLCYLMHCKSYKILNEKLYHYIKHEGTLLDISQNKDNIQMYLALIDFVNTFMSKHFYACELTLYLPSISMLILDMEIQHLRNCNYKITYISKRFYKYLSYHQKKIIEQFTDASNSIDVVGKGIYFSLKYDALMVISNASLIRTLPSFLIAKSYYTIRRAYYLLKQ